MIQDSYAEAIRLLTENREILDHIADYLYEHETITGKEFMKIFRELKGLPDPDEDKKENEGEDAGSTTSEAVEKTTENMFVDEDSDV